MDFIWIKALSVALLPPLDFLLLAALGLLLSAYYRRGGLALVAISVLGLFALSMPVVANRLAGLIEPGGAPNALRVGRAQAIVILGAGSYPSAPEYGQDTVGAATLERLRWGARLNRQSGLPIMVTGGQPSGTRTSEAAQMKAALNEDFRTAVKWLEEKSLTTFESAQYAKAQLAPVRINHIVLVTHAIHMRRARLVFERAGFRVIEAPTVFSTPHPPGILNFLPSSAALELSRAFLHEVLGLGWYHVRLAAIAQNQGQ